MPKLADKQLCTGCSACAAACPRGCITMTADDEGFLCPAVDGAQCTDCGLCSRGCPVLAGKTTFSAIPAAFAACSLDEKLRMESSSGGVFSELAREVLARGGVVFGAAYDEQFNVVHVCAEDDASLVRLRGAKYAQSKMEDTFQQVRSRLAAKQPVLFSGTPCQVAGLKAFLGKPYDNLICVDFVCHGVPSPLAWQAYRKYRAELDCNGTQPVKINLRTKETGWSRYRYSNLFEYPDGSRHLASSGQSLYMKLFVGDYICRPSCESCAFKGYSRVSDLTIGDFWGIWDIAPEMDDDKGTSLILCQSSVGAALLDAIRHRLTIKPVTLEQASAQNPSLLRSSSANPNRETAFAYIRAGEIGKCAGFFNPGKTGILQKIRRKIQTLIR